MVALDFITALCDWLTDLAPVSQPIKSKTETSRDLLLWVFPPLTPSNDIRAEIWLVDLDSLLLFWLRRIMTFFASVYFFLNFLLLFEKLIQLKQNTHSNQHHRKVSLHVKNYWNLMSFKKFMNMGSRLFWHLLPFNLSLPFNIVKKYQQSCSKFILM